MSSPSTSAPVPAADESREDAYVRLILSADDFPAFSKVMSDLMASLRGDEASAQRLANLVLRDYALTVKVIRTANTVHYNRSGRAVQSATHALMLLGARTVRDLASGLLLFEQYRRRSPGMKELMLLSLLTASHAREAAERRGGTDPETAQLCGMFRNLGEVLVAAHLPAEYSKVLRRTQARRGDAAPTMAASRVRGQAAFAVLGCTFEDIGAAIARHWGMPETVRRGMRATGRATEDTLELVTAFGHDLATAIYREDEAGARESVSKVLDTYGKRLELSRDALAAIADAAVVETRETFTSARVALDDLRLTRQIAVALTEPTEPTVDTGSSSESPADANTVVAATTSTTSTTSTPAPRGGPAAPASTFSATPFMAHLAVGMHDDAPPVSGPPLVALRDRLIHDLAAAVDDVTAYEMQRALLVALEAALRGGPFDRACLCTPDMQKGELQARFGLGEGVEALVERLAVPFASNGTVGSALLRGEEVVLSLGTRLSLHEAQWLRGWGAASAGFFPVTLDGTTIGAIYVDRRALATGFDASTLGYLRRVVGFASQALSVRRTRSTPVAEPVAAVVSPAPMQRVAGAAERADLVLRVLRGESLDSVVARLDVTAEELGRWRDEFLAAAVARLSRV